MASFFQVSVEYNPGCDIPSCSNQNLSVHLIYAKSEVCEN